MSGHVGSSAKMGWGSAENIHPRWSLSQLTITPDSVPNFTLHNGIIRFKGKIMVGTTGNLRTQLLNSLHESSVGGHYGERAAYQRMKLIFYWPRMKQEITDYIKKCSICQKNKSENAPYLGPLQPLHTWYGFDSHIHWLCGRLASIQGKNVILVVVDRLTSTHISYLWVINTQHSK